MIEPDYKSLSRVELIHLLDERKITFNPAAPFGDLVDILIDADYDEAMELWG